MTLPLLAFILAEGAAIVAVAYLAGRMAGAESNRRR